MISVASLLIILGVLLLLSAFFSGSETALFSLSRAQVQKLSEHATKSGDTVQALVHRPRRLLISLLVGNMFVNVAISSVLASLADELFGSSGVGVAIGVGTFLLLVCGEVTPKTLAVRNAERVALVVAVPLDMFARLITPLRVALRHVTNLLIHLLGQGRVPAEEMMTADEIHAAVEVGTAQGTISSYEGEVIRNIFEAREIKVQEIMVPRMDMVCVQLGETLDTALDRAREHGRSRLPVYSGDQDNIVGVLHLKDYPAWRAYSVRKMTAGAFLSFRDSLAEPPRFGLVREPFIIPETKRISSLLREMRRERRHIAIVVDEFGGTSGLVTMEDVLEALVGEFASEETDQEPDFIHRDDVVLVNGLTSLREVNRELRLELEDDQAESIGGHVMNLFGRVPAVGEGVDDGPVRLTVTRMDSRQVDQVEVRFHEGER